MVQNDAYHGPVTSHDNEGDIDKVELSHQIDISTLESLDPLNVHDLRREHM
jgi:hypothetical protein